MPVKLPTSDIANESEGFVLGWGLTGLEQSLSNDLNMLRVTILDNSHCQQRSPNKVFPTNICGFTSDNAGYGTCKVSIIYLNINIGTV